MSTKRALALLCAGIAVTGCNPSSNEPDNTNPNPFNTNLPVGQDEDSDGLENQIETNGWLIDIDTLGYGLTVIDKLETRKVFSDPESTDTDNDGLTDYEEKSANTDPQSSDTDGDGLSDYDELRIYKSSPVSKDTDGDATANAGSVPNANLFDGEEVTSLLTSPLDKDTDGDGLTDLEELTSGSATRALIADVPVINLDVWTNPSVSYTGTVTNAQGVEEQVDESFSEGSSVSTTKGRSNTRSSSTVINKSRTAGGSISAGFPWSASIEGHYESSYSKTNSFGMESSSYFDQTRSSEMARALAESQKKSSNREVTYTGGELSILFDLSNSGSLPVQISNVEISAAQFDANDPENLLPIGLLTPEGSGEWSLGFNGLSEQNVATMTTESPQVIKNLARNKDGLFFKVSKYTMVDANSGQDYVVQDAAVQQRTGTLVIDYGRGTGRVLTYQIATNVNRDPITNKPTGLNMATVLGPKILNLSYETQASSATGFEVLTGLQKSSNTSEMIEIGSDVSEGFWAVIGEEDVDVTDKDFADIRLNQGEQITLIFMRDQDQDGLYEREELSLGTNDLVVDTDGDGLSDFDEARTGWSVSFYADDVKVYPDPRLYDTDADNLSDAEEQAAGTDPTNPDTDSDGLTDDIDGDPLTPLAYTLVDEYVWSGRTVNFSNIKVDGGSNREVTVSPGDVVSITMDWALTVPVNNIYCSGCIVQFYMGVQDYGNQCYVSRTMPTGATGSGSISYQFTAPDVPGVYYVNQRKTLEYSCVTTNVGIDPNRAYAVIQVQ